MRRTKRTKEERQEWLAKRREYYHKMKERVTPEEIEARNARRRLEDQVSCD